MDRGFKNVYPLRGGFKAWQRSGFPVKPVKGGNAA